MSGRIGFRSTVSTLFQDAVEADEESAAVVRVLSQFTVLGIRAITTLGYVGGGLLLAGFRGGCGGVVASFRGSGRVFARFSASVIAGAGYAEPSVHIDSAAFWALLQGGSASRAQVEDGAVRGVGNSITVLLVNAEVAPAGPGSIRLAGAGRVIEETAERTLLCVGLLLVADVEAGAVVSIGQIGTGHLVGAHIRCLQDTE